MKKILLSMVALLSVLTAFSQKDWNAQPKSFNPYWMIGVKTGFTQFNGDVNNKSFVNKLGKESKPTFGISLSHQFTPVFSLKVEASNSNYFSTANLKWQGTPLNLSVSGNVSEYAVDGILNLNKLLSNNNEKGDKWNVYISGGMGLVAWKCKLNNTDDGSNVASIGYDIVTGLDQIVTIKGKRSTALVFPFAIGTNLQLADGIWLSAEYSIHVANSDYLDAYNNGRTDLFSTTTIGVKVKLDKLNPFRKRNMADKTSSVSVIQTKPEKPTKRSFLRGTQKRKPEMQGYTGYEGLLPAALSKKDTTHNVKTLTNPEKNIWEAQVDSGKLQITGAHKTTQTAKKALSGNEILTGLVTSYRIQIHASKKYIPLGKLAKANKLKDKLSVELRNDGWYRYFVGQYSTLVEAKAKLLELKAKGVKDPFIVSFKSIDRKVVKTIKK